MKSEEDVTLQEIAEFYKVNFAGEILKYDVRHKNTPFYIKFDEGHLAHLLALHKFGYKRGELLFDRLLNGEITFDLLKKRNEGAFKENYFRMKFFIYVKEVLNDPKIIVYDKKRSAGSQIEADFVFYSQKYKRFLSLAIRKEYNSEFYIPVTFLESKNNKWSNNRHVLLKKTI